MLGSQYDSGSQRDWTLHKGTQETASSGQWTMGRRQWTRKWTCIVDSGQWAADGD
jgi:hypothetical protein